MAVDPLDLRRKKILHRARYRGFREADLLIGGFAEEAVPAMSDRDLDGFETLLEMADQDICDWVAGKTAPPAEADDTMIERLRKFDIAAKIASDRESF